MPSTTITKNTILYDYFTPASFWSPNWVRPESAWLEHAPFGFWLIDAIRPRTILELGVYSGFSFALFCQAVDSLKIECRCYGIDHWKSDRHTGAYSPDIFDSINDHIDAHYKSFGSLIRSDFSIACSHFDDGSIDLLHIDGAHDYESVKADYLTWLPKLGKTAIILFHDTNVHERDFGVARLWRELSENKNHFEFLHGNGLGVLGLGKDFPRPIDQLFRCAADPEKVGEIRSVYSKLGSVISARIKNEELKIQVSNLEAALKAERERLQQTELELGRQSSRINYLAAAASQRVAEKELEINSILRSKSWRYTAPMRRIIRLFRG